jgi:sugar phosphate isomerase/epimerase
MGKPGLALQVFTVRGELERDFVGTLKEIAAMGYPAVQMAWFASSAPDTPELKRVLDDLGLAVAGCHVLLEELEGRFAWEVERCRQLGTRDVLVPWLSPEQRPTDRAGWARLGERLEGLGRRCQELGARFSYHNHEFEYAKVGSETAIDVLLGGCDPELVKYEPDVYWIKAGGGDPVAEIRKYAGRCPLIHLKDMTAGPTPTYAEVGEGIIDFGPIFAAAEAQGVEWYIAEQDWTARPPLGAAALSLKHLREWGKL